MLRQSTRLLGASFLNNVRTKLLSMGYSTDFALHHNPSERLFYIEVKGVSDVATVEYRVISYNGGGEKILDLLHTIVPQSMQGQGLGKVIAQKVFDYCTYNNIKMKLTCSFLQKFYYDNMSTYTGFVVEN